MVWVWPCRWKCNKTSWTEEDEAGLEDDNIITTTTSTTTASSATTASAGEGSGKMLARDGPDEPAATANLARYGEGRVQCEERGHQARQSSCVAEVSNATCQVDQAQG